MGVYIKDMEMPKSCDDCPHPTCTLWQSVNGGERNEKCPIVPVPPHGRLIDADALIEDLERQCKEVFRIDAVSPDDYWITRNEAYNEALWRSWVESFGEYLKTRPTIIEAEE